MGKKDYERAVAIVKEYVKKEAVGIAGQPSDLLILHLFLGGLVTEVFVAFFRNRPDFNANDFRQACKIRQ